MTSHESMSDYRFRNMDLETLSATKQGRKPPDFHPFRWEEKQRYRRTKPRVFLVPQICLDDVPEELMYAEGRGFVDQIYSSDWKEAVRRTNPKFTQVPEVRTCVNEPSDPLRIRVPRNNSTGKANDGIGAVKREITDVEKRKIRDLVRNDRVRYAYDVMKEGYGGFRPRFPPFRDPERREFYRIDPFVTTLQVDQKNYKKFPDLEKNLPGKKSS